MSFEVQKTNSLNKAAFLDEYLKKQAEKSADKKADKKAAVNENELVELAEDFEEIKDSGKLSDITKSLHEKMDSNGDGKLSNSELKKYSDILKEVGLSNNDLLALFEAGKNKVAKNVTSVAASNFDEVDKTAFKEVLAKYPSLNEIFEEVGADKFFDLIDKNKDGKIDSSELKTVSGSDKKADDISLSDIKKLLSDNNIKIKDSKETLQDELDSLKAKALEDEIKEALSSETQSTTVPSTDDVSYASPVYSSSPSYSTGGSYSYSTSASSTQEPKETIQDLEKQKTKKQGELKELNGNLSAVYDGSDKEVAAKKEAMETAKAEYDKLLVSEAESNEEVKALKDALDSNQENIDANDEIIAEKETGLNEKTQAISSKESDINGLEGELAALKACLTDAQAVEITDKNRESVQSKISSLKNKISAKEKEVETAKKELETLNTEKETLEKELDEAKETKKALEAERDNLEKELEGKVSEKTKAALNAYQEARTAFEETKESRASSIKGEIETKQKEINNLDVKIQELKVEETVKENRVSAWSEYDQKRGQALADAANSLYGGTSKGGGLCATGVSQAINKAFGYTTHGNGCDYGNVLSQRSDWVEVTDEIKSVEDLKNLPAGAIVSWSNYKRYGHVFISDGKGNEISDFKNSVSTHYADRGAKYRVFLPK